MNNRLAYIVQKGRLMEEKWKKIKAGDIIRMENDHLVAVSLIPISQI